MVLVVGTSMTSPERASFTLNGLSVGLCVSASVKGSKCTAAEDPWAGIWGPASLPGARELHLERLVGRLVRLGIAEGLEMHGSRRPMVGHMAHRLHQRARPAAIQMLAGFSFREDRPQVERVGGIAPVVVDGDVVLEFGRAQLVEKRGGFRRTRTVIKPETFSLR